MELIIKLLITEVLLELCVHGWYVCPKNCLCEEEGVDCSNRGLKEFPTHFPPYTSYLNLSGNELHYFPDVLQDLQNLADLNLGWNQLHFVPETAFQRLWKLEKLILSGNKFRRLSDIRGVYHAYRLLELDVSNNPIRETGTCSPEYAIYSESIYKIDLSKSVITTINPCAFIWLSNLTHLHLSGNPIQQLTQIISDTVTHLDLSSCDIHYVTTQAFDKMPSLKHLDLSRNPNLKIHTPFNSAYMSESLVHLDASSCGLTELITNVFPNLEYASFRGNFIRELPPRLLNRNHRLTTLDLSENLISVTNYGTFAGAESLTNLDLSSNFIIDFHPETFMHMYKLKKLKLSHNPLNSLGNISAPSIQHLDVSDCDITELMSLTYLNTPDLISLNLSNNPIEFLPSRLRLEQLTELDLSYCRITTIGKETFESLNTLRRLDLRGNRLTNIFHRPTLESMSSIKVILVTNNPWQCGCNTTNHELFLRFVMKRSPTADEQDLTCLSPDTQMQVSWSKACHVGDEKEVRRAKSERQWMAFLVTFAIMSSVVLVLLVLRHNMSYTPNHASRENVNSVEPMHSPFPARSPIADILQLPTYEEAILLPKPTNLTITSSHVVTREVSTWTSTRSVHSTHDNEGEDDNEDDYFEDCSVCTLNQTANASSTSL